MSKLHLWSPLPPAEFAARLAAAIDPEPTGIRIGADRMVGKPVVGHVDGRSVQLRKRINPYRNSFQAYLTADFEPADAGTALVGEIGLDSLTRALIACWLAVIVLIGSVVGVVPMLPVLVLGTCIGVAGRYSARGEGPFLVGFLAQTLDAREVPAG